LVEGPVELLSLVFGAIHPLPPLLAARTQLRGLQALAQPFSHDDRKAILLFDARVLFSGDRQQPRLPEPD
jgi:hypothetical protein